MTQGISRRKTLTGAAAVGLGVPLLAACGDSPDNADDADDGATPSTPAGERLGAASEVPVGGGKIYADQSVVVTQPTEGVFKAFSAVCTHQGCLVDNVDGDSINCICHGSQFSIEDGSVAGGPATSPLPEVSVTVDDGQITTS